MNNNPDPCAALRAAVLRGDHPAIHRETERLMQAVAIDLSRVTRKYGPELHGLLLAVVDSFAASLRLLADEADLAIAAELSKRIQSVTVGVVADRDKEGRP